MGQARHLGVLLGKAHLGVDEDKAHVGPLHGHFRPQVAVVLDGVLHLALAAQAGGVDKGEGAVLVLDGGVHRVPGGAGNVRDDAAVLPCHLVHQGGLAHVGLTDDSHLDDVALVVVLHVLGQDVADTVQQIAGAVAMDRGHHHRVAQAQVVELVELRRGLAYGVALVDAQHHRHPAFQQDVGHVRVCGGDAGADVRDEDDGAGGVDGDLGLLPHLG